MSPWTFTASAGVPGRFLIAATGYSTDGRNVDITTVRGVPTMITSFSSADPFGDASAVLSFPGITPLDDMDSIELRRWLRFYSDIDIYWAPATPAPGNADPVDLVIDPATNRANLTAPYTNAVKVWEGYIASMAFNDESGLEVSCQGALFQVDRYKAKPFFPNRPWPLEALIAEQFALIRRPGLRTKPLVMTWPTGWTRVAPAPETGQPTFYAPAVAAGAKWTGYYSRETGAWDASLTGFVQDQLTPMITRPEDGASVAPGDQWTIRKRINRVPEMMVRNRNRPPDFEVWVGQPGVKLSVTGDSTQCENVIYGQGSDLGGGSWNGSIISNDGSRTDYEPLAYWSAVWPPDSSLNSPGVFVTEAYTKFANGFSQDQAEDVAQQYLARDREPGWTGSITLNVDPSTTMSRWQVAAGMTVLLKGFMGTGIYGTRFHISAVSCSPESGTVDLTVDTRYRDLLTVQETILRNRDPLTPIKMLQVNRASNAVEDIQQPWNYSAGSGNIPTKSKDFHKTRPLGEGFPYAAWAAGHPPTTNPDYYVKCNASSSSYVNRWAGPIAILTSERGEIIRTEFAAYDKNGKVLKIPFHVSIYSLDVSADEMPTAANGVGPSPYINNAFESKDPTTGQDWPPSNYLAPPDSFIVGWGNRVNGVYNRAGFYTGAEADGHPPTGLFVDSTSWSYDNTGNIEYDPTLPNGLQDDLAVTIYAMFYAEASQPVYFMGRLFRKNPGGSS